MFNNTPALTYHRHTEKKPQRKERLATQRVEDIDSCLESNTFLGMYKCQG